MQNYEVGVKPIDMGPGSYWYQIGKVNGPRSGPTDTDRAAICGSAKKNSRSGTDKLLSAISLNLGEGTDNLTRWQVDVGG